MTSRACLPLAAACAALLLPRVEAASKLPPAAAGPVDFDKQVKPIFAAKCLGCHGKSQQQSGLRLDKRQNALRGGDYGAVIMPGRSADSKLVLRLAGPDAGVQMPPTGPLSPEEIGIIRAWIDQGAEFPDTPLEAAAGKPPKPLDPRVKTFLEAVSRGDTAAAGRMLRARKSLANARDGNEATPLMYATVLGGLDMMRLLLDQGADPNARNHRQAAALVWASTNLEAVKLLLERGADPNVRSVEGRTPLFIASTQPQGAGLMAVLLDKGANPDAKDLVGRTALMNAAAAGSVESMRLLLAKGAKPNLAMESGSAALLDAARSRNLAAVKLLIDHGADVNLRSKRGATALDIAASWGATDIVKLLLDKGARVDTQDDRGYTPLMYAAYSESMPVEIVKLLLAKGADKRATGEGETALSLAVKRGDTEISRLLR
jgi:ankyrin repeat protein/mono/diheme cytochrome c family protein